MLEIARQHLPTGTDGARDHVDDGSLARLLGVLAAAPVVVGWTALWAVVVWFRATHGDVVAAAAAGAFALAIPAVGAVLLSSGQYWSSE